MVNSKETGKCCVVDIEECDIFDFMANVVGKTVLHPGGYRATNRLAELCGINEHTKVLDIACGKGTSAVYFAQKYGCDVVGIDIADNLIAQAVALAKKKGLEDKVSFRVADAMNLPYPNNEFDVAFSQAMLVLLSNKDKAIKEALRVTKPGGYLGWIELIWQKEPTKEFLEKVATEICAVCMTNALSFEGWKRLFIESGIKNLQVIHNDWCDCGSLARTIEDEGLLNTLNMALKALTNSRIRRKMKVIDSFFKDNIEYFGYGIYVGRKPD